MSKLYAEAKHRSQMRKEYGDKVVKAEKKKNHAFEKKTGCEAGNRFTKEYEKIEREARLASPRDYEGREENPFLGMSKKEMARVRKK